MINKDTEFYCLILSAFLRSCLNLYQSCKDYFGNNIDVDPQLIFLRELVILNGCEGSQAAFK